jgi:acyl-CoA synthetase (AMP-forming)/AMP-acid ligase II
MPAPGLPVEGSNPSRSESLVHLLLERWRADPHAVPFTFLERGEHPSSALELGELLERARRVAVQLQSRTDVANRVLLVFPNNLDFVIGFLGCLFAGVAAVPTVPPTNRRAVESILALRAATRPSLVLASKSWIPLLAPVLQDEGAGIECGAIEDLLARPESAFALPRLTSRDLAYLQFTSGSTGVPKGVEVTHGNLLHNCGLLREALDPGPDSRMVSWLPFFHDWGLVGSLVFPLVSGTPCYLLDPMEFLYAPFRWLLAISRQRATIGCAPNFAYELCCEAITEDQKAALDLSSWEVAMVGAEPVRKGTLERFARRFAGCGFRREAFYPAYGLAENTLIVSGGRRAAPPVYLDVERKSLERRRIAPSGDGEGEHPRSVSLVGCGRALGDERLLIANPATAMPCGDGEIGEVWVSGGSVTRGYWERRDDTNETFLARLRNGDPATYLRTGDIGFVSNGELFLCGRSKDVIIKGGANYFAEDVEQVAGAAHASLRPGCGAAFAVDVSEIERLVIVHELGYGERPPPEEVIDRIQQEMLDAFGMLADAIVLIQPGSLPKTTSRKICRQQTRALFLREELKQVASWTRW